jgi:hypothetical protein
MNLNDLESRAQRLDQLSRGLAKEAILWGIRAADLQMLLDGVDLDSVQRSRRFCRPGSLPRCCRITGRPHARAETATPLSWATSSPPAERAS